MLGFVFGYSTATQRIFAESLRHSRVCQFGKAVVPESTTELVTTFENQNRWWESSGCSGVARVVAKAILDGIRYVHTRMPRLAHENVARVYADCAVKAAFVVRAKYWVFLPRSGVWKMVCSLGEKACSDDGAGLHRRSVFCRISVAAASRRRRVA